MKTRCLYSVLIFGIFIILLSNSCSHKDEESSVIIPLKIGNYWIYRVTVLNKPDVKIDTLTVTKDTLIRGEKWYIINHSLWHDFKWVLQNKTNGLYAVINENSSGLFLKYKAIKGEIYASFSSKDTAMVSSINEKIKTQAGEFNCYFYASKKDDGKSSGNGYYMSPGIGMIKTLGFWDLNYELISYKIK